LSAPSAAAHGIVPDTRLNISGVITGCDCEDGAGCSDQVWMVAYRPGVITVLEMSVSRLHWQTNGNCGNLAISASRPVAARIPAAAQ